MGAVDFGETIVGKYDPESAYSKLVEEARYEYGHDPYNGTISTTVGFQFITKHPRYGTNAYFRWADDLTDAADKRTCFCIEIKGERLKIMKSHAGLKGKRGIRAFAFFGVAAE